MDGWIKGLLSCYNSLVNYNHISDRINTELDRLRLPTLKAEYTGSNVE